MPTVRRSLVVFALAAVLTTAVAGGLGARVVPDVDYPIAGPGKAGPYRLGDTVRSLHRRKLIRRLRRGCQLDPGQRVARLRRRPISGLAIFSGGGRRLTALSIDGGVETAKGIRIGSSVREARRAYARAEYDPPGSLEPFAEGFLWVNRVRNPRMTLVVDPETRRVSSIGLPAPAFCE
jgi:hypothetical protein